MKRIYKTYRPNLTPGNAGIAQALGMDLVEYASVLPPGFQIAPGICPQKLSEMPNNVVDLGRADMLKNVIQITAKSLKMSRENILLKFKSIRLDRSIRKTGVGMFKTNKLINSLRNATIVMLMVSSAIAQGVPKLDIRIDEEKINKTTLERRPGAEVSYMPGDTIKYFIVASNVGDGLMTNPEIVDPIPAGVTYVPESATGDNTQILFSIDQGKAFMEWPPYYSVRNSKGVLVKRQATPEMITHVKWNVTKNLNPGEQALMDFRVVVSK